MVSFSALLYHNSPRNIHQESSTAGSDYSDALGKRAIPGVKSDAYHLGYFEDKTDRYQIKRKVETEYEPLVQSLYIFGILVFGLTVFSAFVFVIREYVFTFRNRKKQEFINENKLDHYWSSPSANGNSTNTNEVSDNLNLMNNDKQKHWPRSTFSPTVANEYRNKSVLKQFEDVSSVSSWDNHEFVTSREPGLQTEGSHAFNGGSNYFGKADGDGGMGGRKLIYKDKEKLPLEKKNPYNYLEIIPTSESSNKESGSTFYYYTGVQGNIIPKNGKKVYTFSEIITLRPKSDEFPTSSKIQLSDFNSDTRKGGKSERELKKMITTPVLNLQETKFYSAWKAGKAVKELSIFLTNDVIPPLAMHDTVTKKIMIIKLLAIGASDKSLSNPNIYLADFNTFMNRLIDTGIIFDLLNDSKPIIARALVDLLLRYIWCHWQFRTSNHRAIVSQFKSWRFSSPSIQPHHVLFRYLCNIELGIYAVGRMDLQALRDSENKILSLLNYLAVNSFCNDYIGFIPIISQAVEVTDRVLSQRIFYDLLLAIIEKHRDCCMDDYLMEDQVHLKPLVQHGFWIQNDAHVRKTAENIHYLIVERYPQTMSWWKEIEGGRIYINASAKVVDSAMVDGTKQSAVGSWFTFSPPTEKQHPQANMLLNEIKEEGQISKPSENGDSYEASVPGSFNF